jgi:hypothetical protein
LQQAHISEFGNHFCGETILMIDLISDRRDLTLGKPPNLIPENPVILGKMNRRESHVSSPNRSARCAFI